MELLQVKDFGKSGLNTDMPPWDLPLSFLTYAQNFRIFNNAVLGMGGHKGLADLPGGFHAAHIKYSPTSIDNFWLLAGNAIYVYDGAIYTDISTSLTAYATSNNAWTSCSLGRVPILNNGSYHPMYWNTPEISQDMQILPWDAVGATWQSKNWSCKAMRSFGPYLIAMHMSEESSVYPDTVRWSHPAERNDVPATWDETDPASLAGINTLGGDGGGIIDGASLRDSFVLYRDSGITILNHSDDSYVFNAVNLTETTNLANINCIVEIKGAHFIVASNDIVVNSGDTIQSILHQKARIRYAAVLNQDAIDTAFAIHNVTTKEFWACIPTGDSPYPNEAWVYNYRDDTWSIHDINAVAHADYGRVDTATRIWGDGTPLSWDETWASATGNWARKNDSVFNNNIIGVKIDTLSSMQVMDQYTSEIPFTTILERTDYTLTTMQDVNSITRLYPHIKGTMPVTIQVGSQDHAGGPVFWRPAMQFTPGTDRKLDVRTTGELFAFRIVAENNMSFEFSGLDIEYVPAGVR